ncbi:hypothetical protein, partial [Streptomyces sp. NPDC005438]|uniref:hypothetical protein n=1 Tax=Streptomyces sp. NPDC005438 TaxID=3156880 RepID=UPI0033B4AD35
MPVIRPGGRGTAPPAPATGTPDPDRRRTRYGLPNARRDADRWGLRVGRGPTAGARPVRDHHLGVLLRGLDQPLGQDPFLHRRRVTPL